MNELELQDWGIVLAAVSVVLKFGTDFIIRVLAAARKNGTPPAAMERRKESDLTTLTAINSALQAVADHLEGIGPKVDDLYRWSHGDPPNAGFVTQADLAAKNTTRLIEKVGELCRKLNRLLEDFSRFRCPLREELGEHTQGFGTRSMSSPASPDKEKG